MTLAEAVVALAEAAVIVVQVVVTVAVGDACRTTNQLKLNT